MPRRSSRAAPSDPAAGVGAREGSGLRRSLTGLSRVHAIDRAHAHLPAAVQPVGRDGPLPAGRYRVITEEELLEGLSFAVGQRAQTLLFLPADALPGKAREVVPIDPNELDAALAADGLESQD
jgi:hypothetical protein